MTPLWWSLHATRLSKSLSLLVCGPSSKTQDLHAHILHIPGCAHAQQLIWQLFNAVEKGWHTSGDTDTAFLEGKKGPRIIMTTTEGLTDVTFRVQKSAQSEP